MTPDTRYSIRTMTLSRLVHSLPREVMQIAMLFDGQRRLWEVLRDSPLPGRMTMSVVGRLRSLELLAESPPADAAQPQAPGPEQAIASSRLTETSQGALARIRPAPPPVDPRDAPAVTVSCPLLGVEPSRGGMEAPAPFIEPPTPAAEDQPSPAAQEEPPPAALVHPAPAATPRPAPASCERAPSPAPEDALAAEQAFARAPDHALSFDEAEQRFFESWVPEDDQVDTFWDLEESPRQRQRARKRAKRLQQGGWFRQILSLF